MHVLELLALEESCAHVVLSQHRNIRTVQELPRLHGKREHSLQGREFSVNRCVRCALCLSLNDEGAHLSGRNRRHTPLPKVRRQVATYAPTQFIERPTLVHPVIVQDVHRGLLEPNPADFRSERQPPGDVPLTGLKQVLRLGLVVGPGTLHDRSTVPVVRRSSSCVVLLDGRSFPSFMLLSSVARYPAWPGTSYPPGPNVEPMSWLVLRLVSITSEEAYMPALGHTAYIVGRVGSWGGRVWGTASSSTTPAPPSGRGTHTVARHRQ